MNTEENITAIVTAIMAFIGAFFVLTAQQQAQLIPAVVAIIGAVFAYYQAHTKSNAIAAYDSSTPQASSPAIIASLPVRTWTIRPEVRRWLLFGESEADQKSINDQIDSAEAARLVKYQITYSRGYYDIEYGALVGSARS